MSPASDAATGGREGDGGPGEHRGDGPSPARHDLRLVPFAVACWGGAFVGVSGWRPDRETLLALVVGVLLLGIVAVRARRPWLALCLLTVLLASLAAGARSWALHESPVAGLAADGAKIAWAQWKLLTPGVSVIVRRGFDDEVRRILGQHTGLLLDNVKDADWIPVMNNLGKRVRAMKGDA